MELFQRPTGGTHALLVHVSLPDEQAGDLEEFRQLVESAGMAILEVVTNTRQMPDNRYFIGTGKLEELQRLVKDSGANIVLFNHFLSSSQERNLEKSLNCAVLDRTGLILDIFRQRARTLEGRLQVELAGLRHMSTRLIRGWTHLERQSAGIGVRGGPGETQLETDRRLIQNRIDTINRRLDRVRSSRAQGRRARTRNALPVVSMVGYTNAGKSTLFNRLTNAGVFVANQLFATLDPTLRRIDLPGTGPILLADTVGFIRQLPHRLVDAFRATLEETADADLLLHVTDCAAVDRDANIAAVDTVLAEIGADQVPVLAVYNKVDMLDEREPRIDRDEAGVPVRVWVSATTGAGMDLLLSAIRERLAGRLQPCTVRLPPAAGRLRAKLYALGAVTAERTGEAGEAELDLELPMADLERMLRSEHLDLDTVLVPAGASLAAPEGGSYNLGARALRESSEGEIDGLE